MAIWRFYLVGFLSSGFLTCVVMGAAVQPTTRQLAQNYISWSPPSRGVDATNPYREPLLLRGAASVNDLILLADTDAHRLKVIWILGEIASPKSFPFLLAEYQVRPNLRVSISLGSSLGPAEVNYLFDSKILDEAHLRSLLSDIYASQWPTLKNLDLPALAQFTQSHLVEIIHDCRKRSRPQLG